MRGTGPRHPVHGHGQDGGKPYHGILNTSKLRLGTPGLAGYAALDHNRTMRGLMAGDHAAARASTRSKKRQIPGRKTMRTLMMAAALTLPIFGTAMAQETVKIG